jgi:acyl-CoA hydrolase
MMNGIGGSGDFIRMMTMDYGLPSRHIHLRTTRYV